jgi:Zn-dependent protease with chaperone function
MFQEFEGYLFDETVETGRIKISIMAEQSGLSIKGEGIQHKVYWNNLVLEYGGSNNRQVFIKSKLDLKLNLFTNDTALIKEIKNKAGMYGETVLKPLTKDNTKRFFLSFGFLSSVFFAIIIGSILLFYFKYGKLKKIAAKAVPVEIENKLGESIFKASVDQTKIIQVPEVTKALNDIYTKFKPHLKDQPYQFQFYLIRNEELNAFALPGGYVVVHTGLILEAESAEELAGVLAHEISHVTERHAVERIISSLGIVVACQVLLGDVSGLATIIVQGAQFVSMMKFSQSQESEADQMGFELMKKAKISHLGFIDFFKRAKAKKDIIPDQVKDTLSIFSTHPPDESRIKSIDELSKKNSYEPEKLDINWVELKTALKAYLNK